MMEWEGIPPSEVRARGPNNLTCETAKNLGRERQLNHGNRPQEANGITEAAKGVGGLVWGGRHT